MEKEMSSIQSSFKEGRGTFDIASAYWLIEKVKVYQTEATMFFIDYRKAFQLCLSCQGMECI